MVKFSRETRVTLDGVLDVAEYLEFLAIIGRDFASSLNIGDTLDNALHRISTYMDAEAASLFLLEEDSAEVVCRACFGPVNVNGLRLAADAGIVGRSIQANISQIVRDVEKDPDFVRSVDASTGFVTRSILCAPLSVKDQQIGAIQLLNKKGGDGLFSEKDRYGLQVLASSAALAIINARLTTQLIEQEKIRRELELAADIQRNLLPKESPIGFPISGINVPARGVSGDFYDIFELEDGRIFFNVGDVSGKGMNASLLMAKTSSLFHCLGRTIHDPGRLLGLINRELCEKGTRGMFVTMIGGIYEPETRTVRISNAGHEPALHRDQKGNYQSFGAQAPPLGIAVDIVPDGRFPINDISIGDGSLYLFTDGVTEGRLGDGSILGVEGLKSFLERNAAIEPMSRLRTIADKFGQTGLPLHDDLTLLVVEEQGTRQYE